MVFLDVDVIIDCKIKDIVKKKVEVVIMYYEGVEFDK